MRMCMLNRMNAIPAKFADWSANDAGAFRWFIRPISNSRASVKLECDTVLPIIPNVIFSEYTHSVPCTRNYCTERFRFRWPKFSLILPKDIALVYAVFQWTIRFFTQNWLSHSRINFFSMKTVSDHGIRQESRTGSGCLLYASLPSRLDKVVANNGARIKY
jgi:hypothetical protein